MSKFSGMLSAVISHANIGKYYQTDLQYNAIEHELTSGFLKIVDPVGRGA